MIARATWDAVMLVDMSGDKVLVNAWLCTFVAFVVALLVWDRLRRP